MFCLKCSLSNIHGFKFIQRCLDVCVMRALFFSIGWRKMNSLAYMNTTVTLHLNTMTGF